MPTLGKPATCFECNFNIENVEAFIVLTDWIETESGLNFGQVSALTATLVSMYVYTDHSATAAQFHTHTHTHTHQALCDAMTQTVWV